MRQSPGAARRYALICSAACCPCLECCCILRPFRRHSYLFQSRLSGHSCCGNLQFRNWVANIPPSVPNGMRHNIEMGHQSSVGEVVSSGRPHAPYKRVRIRLFGTNKTASTDSMSRPPGRRVVRWGNCLDPVRGCTGGRTNNGYGCWWGCYAKEASRRFHIIFDVPVPMILDELVLSRDLQRLDVGWVRIGVNGDPCFDWVTTARVAEIVAAHDKIPVVLTRVWRAPSRGTLQRLLDADTRLHVTLCAFDTRGFQSVRNKVLEMYSEMGGVAVTRLVTFAFLPESELWDTQDAMAQSGPVLEQPARIMKTNPVWKLLHHTRYVPHISYVSGRPDHRWLSAGTLYPRLPQCATGCSDCKHQCMTGYGAQRPLTSESSL